MQGSRLKVGSGSLRQFVEFEIEDLGERSDRARPDFVDRDRPAELAGDRRELGVLDPTGGDPLGKRRRVDIHVERVAVGRDPFRDVDPD